MYNKIIFIVNYKTLKNITSSGNGTNCIFSFNDGDNSKPAATAIPVTMNKLLNKALFSRIPSLNGRPYLNLFIFFLIIH